jgi:response regulator of citrate/malate metabolism
MAKDGAATASKLLAALKKESTIASLAQAAQVSQGTVRKHLTGFISGNKAKMVGTAKSGTLGRPANLYVKT